MTKTLKLILLATIGISLASCNAITHTVGTGGRGDGKPGNYDVKKKQWYLFWGALPLNNVDSKILAGGSTNYTVRTTTSAGDLFINAAGSYLLGIRSQTIRVSKGN